MHYPQCSYELCCPGHFTAKAELTAPRVHATLLYSALSKNAKGIMEQIREHLAQGESSQEIIALGYAPGTVYKVQRIMRQKSEGQMEGMAQVTAPRSPGADEPEEQEWPGLDDLFYPEDIFEKFDQIDQAEARIEDFQEQARKAEKLQALVAGLREQIESLSRIQAVQRKQIALWEDRWDRLVPLITAMCTQLHCADEVMVASHLPEHLKPRSSEAMATVRKHSQYKGEAAEQGAALVASLNLPPVSRGRGATGKL